FEALRELHEAGAREIEVRGTELDRLRAEQASIHESLHDALAHVQQRDHAIESLRTGIADALSGTEDDAARERLLAAESLSLTDELALLIDARDRRRRERDEARDQILALSAEIARERDRVQRLRGYALSFGARLWRLLTFQRLDYDLGPDED
ncbi:MAG: hypothetical protein AAFP22_19655, partial [Planctomycetota bacterium]